jgi:hypothetical protein
MQGHLYLQQLGPEATCCHLHVRGWDYNMQVQLWLQHPAQLQILCQTISNMQHCKFLKEENSDHVTNLFCRGSGPSQPQNQVHHQRATTVYSESFQQAERCAKVTANTEFWPEWANSHQHTIPWKPLWLRSPTESRLGFTSVTYPAGS